MAFPFETVAQDLLLSRKPAGLPEFGGWSGAPLEVPAEEYRSRLQRVLAAMVAAGLDLLIIKGAEDIRWLTGFHTIGDSPPQSVIVPRVGEPIMVARLIEVDLVHKYTWVQKVWTCPDAANVATTFYEVLRRCMPQDGSPCKLGVPFGLISGHAYLQFVDFAKGVAGAELVDASSTVERVRLLKSDEELRCIARASEIAEAAMAEALAAVKSEVLLSDLHVVALAAMLRGGSEDPAYSPIVRTTDPSGHGSWEVGERVAGHGLVFLEFAASVRGHHAPLMRTAYVLGAGEAAAPPWLLEAEALIQRTFEVCLPMMVPGAIAAEVDAAGRKIMTSSSCGLTMSARLAYTAGGTATNPAGNAGWGDADFSLVGHNRQPLQEGMVFHFIPWFQKYGGPCSGPIGMSDTVVVTAQGGRRVGRSALRIALLREDGSRVDGQ